MSLLDRAEARASFRTDITQSVRVDIVPEAFPDEYVFLAAPSEVSLVSSSAADAAAGLGAQSVELNMMDATFNTTTIPLALNGVTPVAVPNGPWFRCNGMRIVNAGANGVSGGATGNLSLTADTGGSLMAHIIAGGNRFQACIYTIPSDEQFSMDGFRIEVYDPKTNDRLIGFFTTRRPVETAWNDSFITEVMQDTSPTSGADMRGFVWPPGTDIRLRALASSTPTSVFGQLLYRRKQRQGAVL